MQDLHLYIILSIKNPNITEMGVPPPAQTYVDTYSINQKIYIIATASNTVAVNSGISPFKLVQMDETTVKPLITRELLLKYFCSFRNQKTEANPNPYLHVSNVDRQMKVVAPNTENLARDCLLQNLTMDSTNKISMRNLNTCGIMTGYCTVINYE